MAKVKEILLIVFVSAGVFVIMDFGKRKINQSKTSAPQTTA